ncbi:MAG: NADPH:quinone oxidoreductase family protein, partial [Alphaproteobacteria bacterium]|nr:NADPH:quinone oxidoreductase family protein [Alphaproteobacteria bacterium]
MRAWVCRAFGDLDQLQIEDLPSPDPGPGQVVVRPKGASVTFVEMLVCQGKHQHKPDLPFTPGGETAGVVERVGEGVTRFREGDEVLCGSRFAACAEEVLADEKACFPLPGPFDFNQGAAFMSAYKTAYVALVPRGHLQPGETLLVHAAAGGVGLAAVELGKVLGATVIGTASSEEKLKIVRNMGADHVINYTEGGFREQVKELTGGRGADVIYDPVGGDVFDESIRCIAPFGRILIIGFTSGRIPQAPVNYPLIKQFSIVGVRAGEYGRVFPEGGRKVNEELLKLAEQGKFHPHIGGTYA